MDPSTTSDPAAPGMRSTQPTLNESFSQVDGYAEQLRVKLPLAPPGLLNGYMTVVPWFAIIVGIIGVLFSLLGLILSSVVAPLMFMYGGGSGLTLVFNVLLALLISALEVAGGFMMLQHRLTGWWLLALGMVVSLLSSLLHVSAIGLIFWLIIAYIHLQVKPNYN